MTGPSDVDQWLRTVGHGVWKKTYARWPNDDSRALGEIHAWLKERGQPSDDNVYAASELVGMGKWVAGACRCLESDASYFSAMACTDISASSAEDLHVPWPAFLVKIPDGLITVGDHSYGRALVWSRDLPNETFALMKIYPSRESWDDALPLFKTGPDLSTLLFDPTESKVFDIGSGTPEEVESDGRTQRACEAVRRAIVGMLYTLQHTKNFVDRGAPGRLSRDPRFGPPKHRTIVIGKPLSIDCRPAVREYINLTRRRAPSVQALVRGHYKRQVIGSDRVGRKVIWVEPYWRGPEDAPILARPYRVGPSEKESDG